MDPVVRECDVLVMGGGIGGLMAAIAAADAGARVIVAEKADTRRSGSGATGNDHFVCYIPEVHGDFEDFMRELKLTQAGLNADEPVLRAFAARSFEIARDWHKWGINMKLNGQWTFEGHAYPGHMRTHLKYDGRDQKKILTREALKRGVVIENKTPVAELLTDRAGRICGAMAIDVSDTVPAVKLFRTKTVIAATGSANRIYSSCTPAWMFNVAGCPACTGTGVAASYRVGATLVNMDIPAIPAGPKYFSRAGKGTWIGILRDYHGKNIGPFLEKPSREHGDITSDVWPSVFRDKQRDGTGPVYMDCSELSEEDMQYLLWAFTCEGDTSLVEAMEKQGIDLRRHMVEFGSYECTLLGRGVEIDPHAATNVPGLYAVGDQVGNFLSHIAGAATMGRIAGERAAEYARTAEPDDRVENHPVVAERRAFYTALMERKHGSSWKELNITVNQLMDDYVGVYNVRSETLMSAGLKYFGDLRKRAESSVMCRDAHELMRALEAFDLLDLAEVVCLSALERKETRGGHRRADYTFTNPLLNGMFVTARLQDGRPVISMRPAR
ncbi:FAD-binding protein [Moorella sulfitireducens]|uniref:FAD-binding protein n=1 Tax=Neomoorella sulfitireducens TaxID=2972948 RepID=UPI0021AC129B|nr:FAD-binding protein [Moorella sulfitireducens]